MRPASIASDDGTELLVGGEYGSEGGFSIFEFSAQVKRQAVAVPHANGIRSFKRSCLA